MNLLQLRACSSSCSRVNRSSCASLPQRSADLCSSRGSRCWLRQCFLPARQLSDAASGSLLVLLGLVRRIGGRALLLVIGLLLLAQLLVEQRRQDRADCGCRSRRRHSPVASPSAVGESRGGLQQLRERLFLMRQRRRQLEAIELAGGRPIASMARGSIVAGPASASRVRRGVTTLQRPAWPPSAPPTSVVLLPSTTSAPGPRTLMSVGDCAPLPPRRARASSFHVAAMMSFCCADQILETGRPALPVRRRRCFRRRRIPLRTA